MDRKWHLEKLPGQQKVAEPFCSVLQAEMQNAESGSLLLAGRAKRSIYLNLFSAQHYFIALLFIYFLVFDKHNLFGPE